LHLLEACHPRSRRMPQGSFSQTPALGLPGGYWAWPRCRPCARRHAARGASAWWLSPSRLAKGVQVVAPHILLVYPRGSTAGDHMVTVTVAQLVESLVELGQPR